MQLMEILRRLKAKDMGKFNFITNFGLSVEMLDKVKHELIFLNIDNEV